MINFCVVLLLIFCLVTLQQLGVGAKAEQCGKQAGGALCPDGLCCSQFGFCGSTYAYCEKGCQSQCSAAIAAGGSSTSAPVTLAPAVGGGGGNLSSVISEDLFNEMLKHRNDSDCPAKGFYTYNAFIAAAKSFNGFGTTGDINTRKREIAAFLAQTSHETTGGRAISRDGPYAWGYCYLQEEGDPADYCSEVPEWPCAPGKKYYGRGPFQISYNFNYGQAGKVIGSDLLNNPDLVVTDPTISFKTALWFWMRPLSPIPSCHEVMTGQWKPSYADTAAGLVPGFGVTTNIINGGNECGKGGISWGDPDRIGFYKRYCDILGVSYGDNLQCYDRQQPFVDIAVTPQLFTCITLQLPRIRI